jgi:hypothetical protein
MALSIFLYLFISTVVVLIVSVYMYIKSRGSENPLLPIDWPVVGILPSFVANLRNFHDYLTAVLAASGCNFKVGAAGASSARFFITSDPANVQHVGTGPPTHGVSVGADRTHGAPTQAVGPRHTRPHV